jgi:hypothetical protein
VKCRQRARLVIVLAATSAVAPPRAFAQDEAPAAPAENAAETKRSVDAELKKLRERTEKLEADKEKLKEKLESAKAKLDDVKSQAKEQVEAAKKEAEEKLKNALNKFKYVDISFGVLPNQDSEINNYSKLQLNWGASLASAVTYYSRTFARSESTREVEPSSAPNQFGDSVTTSETATTTKRTDVNFELLKWAPSMMSLGGARIKPGFGIGAYYINEDVETRYGKKVSITLVEQSFEMVVPANGNIDDNTQSLLPQIAGDFELTVGGGFKMSFGAGYIFFARDKLQHKDKGSYQMPSIPGSGGSEGSDSAYTDYVLANGKSSTTQGFRVATDVELKTHRFGGLGLHASYLEKWGDTSSFVGAIVPDTSTAATTPGTGLTQSSGLKQKYVVQKQDVFEEKVSSQLGLSYSMDYLAEYGITPIVRLNRNEDRLIRTPKDGKRDDQGVRSYDVGIIFKY